MGIAAFVLAGFAGAYVLAPGLAITMAVIMGTVGLFALTVRQMDAQKDERD